MRGHHSILSWWSTGERVTGPGWTQSQPPTSGSWRARFMTPSLSLTLWLLDLVALLYSTEPQPPGSDRRVAVVTQRGASATHWPSSTPLSPQTPIWACGPPTALHVLRFLPSTGARHRRLFFKISRPLRSEAFLGCRHEYQRPHLCSSIRTHAASSEVQRPGIVLSNSKGNPRTHCVMLANATPPRMLIRHRRPLSSNNFFALLFVALITKYLTVQSDYSYEYIRPYIFVFGSL